MINYIEYLNVPTKIAIILVSTFFILQIIGEVLEFKGKAVPEFIKIRKYFKRKKEERDTINKIPKILKNVDTLLNDVNSHYSKDNIIKRDKWIDSVNKKLENDDICIKEIDKKLDKNNKDIVSLLIDSKRNNIINFASNVIDENSPVTREQFKRIFKLYEEYEKIIKENGFTNGEVDIAFRIITESYERHMKNHTFIEDIRGYDIQ